MAVYKTTQQELTQIAEAIRNKSGLSNSLDFPSGFANAINDMSFIGDTQSKTISPSEQEQNITADQGYDGLSQVTVNAISSDYVGSNIPRLNSDGIVINENIVHVSTGYYSQNASKAIVSGSVISSNISITYPPLLTLSSPYLHAQIYSSNIISIMPAISGYITSFPSVTITISGAQEYQFSTISGGTINPSTSEVLLGSQGYLTTGSIYAGAISPMYVGSGIVQLSAQNYYGSSQTYSILSGRYLSGQQTIKGDANLVSDNIKFGVSIYGITGIFTDSNVHEFEDAYITNQYSILSFQEVSKIDSYTFCNRSNLTQAYFPNVSSIGNYAFSNCNNLSVISFPLCTFIGTSAFAKCSIESLFLPICETISDYAFFNNNNLLSVSLPVCETIDNAAFYQCVNLLHVSIPNLKTISNNTFRYCYSLSQLNMPSVEKIGSSAFQSCDSLESIDFPLCSEIGSYAFAACINLRHVNLPNCKSIQSWAFLSCRNIEELNIQNCEYIGISNFENIKISSLTLNKCSYLGGAFAKCSNLANVFISGYSDTFDPYMLNSCPIEILNLPDVSATNGGANDYSMGSTLKTLLLSKCVLVSSTCFYSLSKLETISICTDSTYKSLYSDAIIGYSAFAFCSSLSFADIAFIDIISYNAFRNCRNLTSINMPNVKYIMGGAFDTTGLRSLSLPLCSSIAGGAFSYCSNLTEIHLPICTNIGNGAFAYCSNIASVELNQISSLRVGDLFLGGVSNLITLSLESCTSLSLTNMPLLETFYAPLLNCNSAYQVAMRYTMPNIKRITLENIAVNCLFSNCSYLESVVLLGADYIYSSMFQSCSSLSYVSISTATVLWESAFAGCTNLTFINCDSCKEVRSNAFKNCVNLSTIRLIGNQISNYAFSGCTSLLSVYILFSSPDYFANIESYAFRDTPITRSEYYGYYGSIYVPAFMLSDYQTYYSSLSARFVGI